MYIINVPTINDSTESFVKLFNIWAQIKESIYYNNTYIFEFSRCDFLRPNAVAFLGGLFRLLQYHRRTVLIKWDSFKNKVLKNLEKNGFSYVFRGISSTSYGNSIPYKEHYTENQEEIINYLKNHWLGRGCVNVSTQLCDAVAGTVWEIYTNAFEHGRSKIGVISCGQHYPNLHKLKLTVVDFGIGIPYNVNLYMHLLQQPPLPAPTAIQWAFQPCNTTRQGRPGGSGLNLLKEFVKINNGDLEVYSHNGYALINKNYEIFETIPSFFAGTIVNITIRCNEAYYCLTSELDQELLF